MCSGRLAREGSAIDLRGLGQDVAVLDRRLDAILLSVGTLRGTVNQRAVALHAVREDLDILDERLRALTDSVQANGTWVAVLNRKLLLTAATSGGLGSVLVQVLRGG